MASLPRLIVNPNRTRSWDWSMEDYFVKTGSGSVTYADSSSNTDTFTVVLSSTELTLTGGSLPPGKDKAQAELILTAKNACGAAKALVEVTLQPKSPPRVNPDNPIPNITMVLSDAPVFIHLPPHFLEDDGDLLTYSESHSGSSMTVAPTITGVNSDSLRLALSGLGNEGDVQVTIRAEDPEGSDSQSFTVSVQGVNLPPTVDPPLRDTTLASGGYMAAVTLSDHFSDPDADELTYMVSSLPSGTATGSILYGVLIITTGSATGTATITVTATDKGDLMVSDTFEVTVTQNETPEVDDPIEDVNLATGGHTATAMLPDHFTDPDGKPADLTYAAASGNPAVATASITADVLTVASGSTAGAATITVTATDKGDLTATDDFTVTVTPDCAITLDSAIADTALVSGGDTATYALTEHFSSACSVTYAATTSAPGTAAASVASDELTVTTGGTPGEATIKVTASAVGVSSVSDDFTVTVTPDCAITLDSAIADTALVSDGHTATYALTEHFSSACSVTYAATTSAPGTATASVASDELTVTTGGTPGEATIKVTASAVGVSSVSDDFTVTVTPDCAITLDSAIADTALVSDGDTATYALPEHFSSACSVTYAATTSAPGTATASVASDELTVTTGGTPGEATIKVTASAVGVSSVSDDFTVTVARNQVPIKVGTIPGRTLQESGSAEDIDVSTYFRDPEGQAMTYAAGSDAPNVATTSTSGSTVTVNPNDAGTATISVTATDTKNAESAPQTFVVTVCGTPGIARAIPAQTLLLGASAEIDLDDYFSNPNSGNLSYTTARTGVLLTLNVSADRTLMIEPDVVGTATVMVTAENGCGNTKTQSFGVTVRGTPVANGTIADQTLRVNGASVSFDVASYFTEPDGDDLTYSVSVDYPVVRGQTPDIVTASMNGSTLTLRPLSTPDKITITVTAADTDGSASQSFVLTVTSAP